MFVSIQLEAALHEVVIRKLNTQEVVRVLEKAGFSSAIRTKRRRRSGYNVGKVNPYIVSVTYYDWEGENDDRQWGRILDTLMKAGYIPNMGFGNNHKTGQEALKIARQNGMVMLTREKG